MPLKLVVDNVEKQIPSYSAPRLSPANDAGVDAMIFRECVRVAAHRHTKRSLESIRDYEDRRLVQEVSLYEDAAQEKFWIVCAALVFGILVVLGTWFVFGVSAVWVIVASVVIILFSAMWEAIQPPAWQDSPIDDYKRAHRIPEAARKIMDEVRPRAVSTKFVASVLGGKYIMFCAIYQSPAHGSERIRIPFFVVPQD